MTDCYRFIVSSDQKSSPPDISYSEATSFITAVEATSNVVRFHGHLVTKQQSVADHSAKVAMMAYAIALEKYKSIERASRVSTFALFHDITEGMLRSDINSTVKAKYGIRELVKKIERDVVEEAFPDKDSWVSQDFTRLFLEDCSIEDYQILKMADTLDFGMYVQREWRMGNRTVYSLFSAFKSEYSSYPDTLRNLEVCRTASAMIVDGIA